MPRGRFVISTPRPATVAYTFAGACAVGEQAAATSSCILGTQPNGVANV